METHDDDRTVAECSAPTEKKVTYMPILFAVTTLVLLLLLVFVLSGCTPSYLLVA